MPPKRRTKKELKANTEGKELPEDSIEDAQKRRNEFIKKNLYDSEDELTKKYTDFFESDPFYVQHIKKKDAIKSGIPRILQDQKEFQKEREKEIKKEAETRERDFFIKHKDDNDDVFLEKYKVFAYNDPYYKIIFSKEKPPTLDYIKDKKYYYYRKFEMPQLESTREFFKELLTEKNPYILIKKFKEYLDREDVDQILKMKFKGKELSPVGIRYKILKYLEDYGVDIPLDEHKKYFEIQKIILNILLLYNNSTTFKEDLKNHMDQLEDEIKDKKKYEGEKLKEIEKDLEEKKKNLKQIEQYLENELNKPYTERDQEKIKTYEKNIKKVKGTIKYSFKFEKDNKLEPLIFQMKIISFLHDVVTSELSNEDLKDMLNQYLVDTDVVGSTIYITDYFQDYLKQYQENLPIFKEEQKIKKFLRELLKLIVVFNSAFNKEEKRDIWFRIETEINNFKNDEYAPESRREIFDKLYNIRSYSGVELFSNVIKNYLKQYSDLKEGKIESYKKFDVFLNEFIKSNETTFYLEREKKYETLPLERKERMQMSIYDKPVVEDEKVIAKEVIDLLNEQPVQNDIMEFSKIKLSNALLKVSILPEYDLNSDYIKDVLKYVKNNTKNTFEFLNKIITLITYLSKEVNNIVQFKYKANINQKDYYIGTNNSFFINNVKKLFYLPDILANLRPNEMLSNVFYNPSIPEDTKKNILCGIEKFISNSLENSIKSIIKSRKEVDVKNMYTRAYKTPAKIYTYIEPLTLKPIEVGKPFIQIKDDNETKNVAKSPYQHLLFEDESQNFEIDNVFYNEEYIKSEEVPYLDGTKQIIDKPYNEIYRFKNLELWNIIQKQKIIYPDSYSGKILNPYSKRLLNPDFVKEFEEVYSTKKLGKELHEEQVETIKKEEEKKKDEDIKEVEELPDLLDLINKDLASIISNKNNIESKDEADSGDNKIENKYQQDKFISVLINKDNKTYFIILNKDKNDVIKYIYNIHDNILEEIPNKQKDEVIKNSDPNDFYTLLYCHETNKKIKPTFTSENNDHALIMDSLNEIKNDIKNNSGQDIKKFLSDILNNTNYSTFEDIKKLKIVFDDKNAPIVSFEEIKKAEKDGTDVEVVEENFVDDSGKKYIAFIYEYKDDQNNVCKNMVIFTKEGFYISSIYDVNNEDFIDKDEERGILKSDILKDSTDIKKTLEQFKNNIYSAIYLEKNKLLPCSNETISKYLEDISKNKNIKGTGNLDKYINDLDNSSRVDFEKIKIEIDSEKIPNFKYKKTDCINNEKMVNSKPQTKIYIDTKSVSDKSDSASDSVSASDSDKSDSDKSDSDGSDNESVSSSNKSSSNKKITGYVSCINCTKEIMVDDALKSVVPNKNEEFDTIYFCSFPCFEKYDIWPSVKKIKK